MRPVVTTCVGTRARSASHRKRLASAPPAVAAQHGGGAMVRCLYLRLDEMYEIMVEGAITAASLSTQQPRIVPSSRQIRHPGPATRVRRRQSGGGLLQDEARPEKASKFTARWETPTWPCRSPAKADFVPRPRLNAGEKPRGLNRFSTPGAFAQAGAAAARHNSPGELSHMGTWFCSDAGGAIRWRQRD